MINALERVDADDGVKMAVDPAGDHRHYAAAARLLNSAVRVPNAYVDTSEESLIAIFKHRWIGGRYATMLNAKRADKRSKFSGIRFPRKRKVYVKAVALTVDQRECDLRCLWNHRGEAVLLHDLAAAPSISVMNSRRLMSALKLRKTAS